MLFVLPIQAKSIVTFIRSIIIAHVICSRQPVFDKMIMLAAGDAQKRHMISKQYESWWARVAMEGASIVDGTK